RSNWSWTAASDRYKTRSPSGVERYFETLAPSENGGRLPSSGTPTRFVFESRNNAQRSSPVSVRSWSVVLVGRKPRIRLGGALPSLGDTYRSPCPWKATSEPVEVVWKPTEAKTSSGNESRRTNAPLESTL